VEVLALLSQGSMRAPLNALVEEGWLQHFTETMN
jgi:hypothetical protein